MYKRRLERRLVCVTLCDGVWQNVRSVREHKTGSRERRFHTSRKVWPRVVLCVGVCACVCAEVQEADGGQETIHYGGVGGGGRVCWVCCATYRHRRGSAS